VTNFTASVRLLDVVVIQRSLRKCTHGLASGALRPNPSAFFIPAIVSEDEREVFALSVRTSRSWPLCKFNVVLMDCRRWATISPVASL
jgi:hypothetical protein